MEYTCRGPLIPAAVIHNKIVNAVLDGLLMLAALLIVAFRWEVVGSLVFLGVIGVMLMAMAWGLKGVSGSLRSGRRHYLVIIALVTVAAVAFLSATVATFAWYVYNTRAHTTDVHMAAGAGVSLQIANKFEGPYGSSAVLDEFVGILNPVSTNNVLGGFQKVIGFTNGTENQSLLLANLFDKCADTEEAIEFLGSYDMCSPRSNTYHMFITDRSGRSVIVEWLDGKTRVTEDCAVTNFVLYGSDGSGDSDKRYAKMRSAIDDGILTTYEAMSVLEAVSQKTGYTSWSAVYDLDSGEVAVCIDHDYSYEYVFI